MKPLVRSFRENIFRKWKITPEIIEELKADLEALGPIQIRSYKSKFSYWSWEHEATHSEPAQIDESNHVDILLDDKVIIQLCLKYSVCMGALFEENVPENLREETERILKSHGYTIGKKANPRRERLFNQVGIILAFALAFLWTFKFLILRIGFMYKYRDVPPGLARHLFPDPEFFDILFGALWLVIGIIWVYKYRKTPFK